MIHIERCTLAVTALLISAIAAAADFRVLNFGAACDDLMSLEAAQGAIPVEGKLPSGYQFAFRAREMERDALVGYSCKDGKFYRGAYIYDVKDAGDATELYGAIKRRVTRQLGAPYYDFASAEHKRKMKDVGAELSRVDTQVAFWKSANAEAHASVAEPTKERGWRVSLSYTALSAL